MGVRNRFQSAWNAFRNNDPGYPRTNYGASYGSRPDRPRLTRGNERSIITAIFNRIATDAANITLEHCKTDTEGRYLETIDSGLNNCLTVEANIDQTHQAFLQDLYLSMLDEGHVAVVPVDTTIDPANTDSYDIVTMRTGKVLEWYPAHVKVRVYNDRKGEKQDLILPKRMVSIIENPFYAVMNEPNSTMQRLARKLALMDIVDEKMSSGKLDLIIQLPYAVKSESRRAQADKRRRDIVDQLTGSPLGIAYTDGTEKITQLNRPLENNLMKQIEYLTSMLYSQLTITPEIMNGTADERTMLNYFDRTVAVLVNAAVSEMKRKFLTKTARTQGQTIMYFRDPFKLVPVSELAEISDKLTRNEIATSNEMRQVIGWKSSKDPNADKLRNSNLNHPDEGKTPPTEPVDEETNTGGENQNG